MADEAFALSLARAIREEARPLLGTPAARERTGTAHGGDPTYGIDAAGERVVEKLFAGRDDVAYFTEDAGLVTRGRPQVLYLVDPIDGTRPATAGYETCAVTIAVAPFGDGVALSEVTYGCIVELGSGNIFEARRGAGVVSDVPLRPSGKRELRGLFWGGGFRGQPAVPTAVALAGLFDVPGSEGAFFDQGSSAYSLSRVATGQLDAVADPGPSLLEEVPELEAAFRAVGGGSVLHTVTYDCAAGVLLLREMGLPVTDAQGRSLDDVPLLDADGKASPVDTVAAATPELHEAILTALRDGFDRVRALVEAVGVEALGPGR